MVRLKEVLSDARSLLKAERKARSDNEISEADAIEIVDESFALARDVIGPVKLSAGARNLLKASAEKVLALLDEPAS